MSEITSKLILAHLMQTNWSILLTYRLFYIKYNPATLYSVTMDGGIICGDEATFMESIKTILGDQYTIKVINSLYSQSLEETEKV